MRQCLFRPGNRFDLMNNRESSTISLLKIYLTFLKVGSVTFGGGYAMLPILQAEVAEKQGWVSKEDVMDFYAVSQGLPGIIAVNVGGFIGYKLKKAPGALAAIAGVVSPCLVIIIVIAACLRNFQDNIYVKHALAGISVCVSALILSTVIDLWKKGVKDLFGLIVFLAVAVCSLLTSVSPVFYVPAAAAAGIFFGRHRGDSAK